MNSEASSNTRNLLEILRASASNPKAKYFRYKLAIFIGIVLLALCGLLYWLIAFLLHKPEADDENEQAEESA